MTPSKSDRIAICGELLPSSLKQRLLFFDRIGVLGLETMIRSLRSNKSDATDALVNDLEFLQSKSFVFEVEEPTILFSGVPGRKGFRLDDVPWFSSVGLSEEDLADHVSLASIYGAMLEAIHKGPLSTQWFDAQCLFFARIGARSMQRTKGLEATAVRSEQLILPEKVQDKIQRQSTNAIDIVLDKLPMPSEQTPWEQILDFKADTEAQGYLQGLKVWMGEVARQKLTPVEANEKLEWLLFQHKQHMKAHKLSYRWGTLGGTFVAAAEIFEDLVKIKWSKAAGAVVSILDRRLELMKSELANPAKEVSYIVKAQEQFGE